MNPPMLPLSSTASAPITLPNPPSTQMTQEQIQNLLSRCDWIDKTLYVARQVCGGASLNGFGRAIGQAQRIRRQRQRSTTNTLKRENSNMSNNNNNATDSSNNNNNKTPDCTEEEWKNIIMNTKTTQKLIKEFERGLSFCLLMHDTIRSIVGEMGDPGVLPDVALPLKPPPPKNGLIATTATTTATTAEAAGAAAREEDSLFGMDDLLDVKPVMSLDTTMSTMSAAADTRATAKPGSAEQSKSELRKHRKKKPPSDTSFLLDAPKMSDESSSSKRKLTKKDMMVRFFEVSRFRDLREGDRVAARTSSRDLWILSRVVKSYPCPTNFPHELLALTPVRVCLCILQNVAMFFVSLFLILNIKNDSTSETFSFAKKYWSKTWKTSRWMCETRCHEISSFLCLGRLQKQPIGDHV